MAMPRASATLLVALAALVALSFSFSTGDACDNVPSMSINEVCEKACSNVSPPQVQLCQSTLWASGAPFTAEITVYAVAAAKAAKKSYNSSMAIIERLLDIPTLPEGEKAAYEFCQDRYRKALQLMIGVANQMSICVFPYAREEYASATVLVIACGDELTDFQYTSPLYAANAADLNNTFVAYDLGGLIVVK